MITILFFQAGPATVMMICTFCCSDKHKATVIVSMALADQAPTSMGALL